MEVTFYYKAYKGNINGNNDTSAIIFHKPYKTQSKVWDGTFRITSWKFLFFYFYLIEGLHPCLLLFDVIPHFFASYGSTTFLLRLFSHFNTAKCRVILDRFIFNFQTFSFYCKNYGLEMLVFITVVVFYMALLLCDSHAGRNTPSFIETPLSSLYLPSQSCLFWLYIVLNYWYASLKNPCDPSVPWSHKV